MTGAETRELTIINQRGLHARAAAKFVKVAADYDACVTVCMAGTEVCGTSIMGLMMLAAGAGSRISVRAEGAEAGYVLDALSDLVASKFDED
jgi:phosphocarrier protein